MKPSLTPERRSHNQVADKISTEADYFAGNADRTQYPKFRREHFFVGSGVIEAGCKTVIGSRLKQSGMFWAVEVSGTAEDRISRGLVAVW